MNRWLQAARPGVAAVCASLAGALLPCLSLFAVAASALLMGLPAHAQSVAREVPADVRYARLQVLQTPLVLVDDQPARLSPGARIRNPMNLLVLPATLAGQNLPVVFRRDPSGLVHEVWVLTEAEAATLLRNLSPGAAAATPPFLDALALIFALRR